MIRTILVDDEDHARDRLRFMLKDEPNIELLASCINGVEAIQKIEELKPDLVFLDIEMPELNGFDVIKNLDMETMPIIVFVTAFSEYALEAFEVEALDYMHKPFDDERLRKAIERAERQLDKRDEIELKEKIDRLLKEKEEDKKLLERFVVKTGGNIFIVKVGDIQWIEASGNYVNLITEKKKYLYRSTLSSLIEGLDENKFYQIHRSVIVNMDFVDHLEENSYGDFTVIMTSGEELKMSRNYKGLIRSF